MKLEFSNIINSKKETSCIILGHGPSLNPHLNKLQNYRDRNIILIGCNNWYDFYDIEPDFWVLCSSDMRVDRLKDRINKLKNTIVAYGDSVDLSDRGWVSNNITTNYLPYDQRHHNNQKCNWKMSDGSQPKCCSHIIQDRLTIQEEVKKYSNVDDLCTFSDTVAVQMLCLGILLGCKPIYVSGLDLTYEHGFAKNNRGLSPYPGYDFERERIFTCFSWLDKCARNIGGSIINLNQNSRFNTFIKGVLE